MINGVSGVFFVYGKGEMENSKKTVNVTVPGSKSITNRALLLAAMSEGTSVLRGCMTSDDAHVFLECIRTLGFSAQEQIPHTDSIVKNSDITIRGCGGKIPVKEAELYVGSAGTAARFLVAMLALSDGTYLVRSSEQMKKRPMQPLIEALRNAGAEVECTEEEGHFPLRIIGAEKCGRETKGELRIRVNIDQSSQFLSALLIAAGTRKEDTVIEVTGSHGLSYVDMTIQMMHSFGVEAGLTTDEDDGSGSGIRIYTIKGGKGYRGLEYGIEPDMSAAAYFYAAAALSGGSVAVNGVTEHMLQGDTAFLDVLKKMGDGLHGGFTVDMSAFSDQALTLAAIAAYADAPITITGIGHIRLQECDRIRAICENLGRMGIRVTEREDGVTIEPGTAHGAEIETYDDHRVAMSFALCGLRTDGIRIGNKECCRKTFAEYFEVLEEVKNEFAKR